MDQGNRLTGLMLDPGHPLLVGLLGILKAGGGFVPLDPSHPPGRLGLVVADCGLRVLVTQSNHLPKALEVAAENDVLEHVVCLDSDPEGVASGRLRIHGRKDLAAARGVTGIRRPSAGLAATAYAIYTSGSTGAPKGVPITHRNLVPLLLWSRDYFGLGAHTRALQSLSYAFDFGVFEILTTLLFGGTLHLAEPDRRGDLEAFAERLRRESINTVHATPSFARALLAVGGGVESLEILHLGGEPLDEALVDQALAAGERVVVYNGYGPTEATINCAIFEAGACGVRPREGLPSVPIGRPSAENTLYVLDGLARLVPIGIAGELCVGGPGISRGYLNLPDRTAEKFIPNPFADPSRQDDGGPGGRLYRTGDRVRWRSDGDLEFLGRRDQQVKIRGYRIEPGEVEAALAGHPEVLDCAVTAHRPPTGEPYLVAYVVASRQPFPASAELRLFLGRRLPPYMVPQTFVLLPELPRTSTGKLDRRALPVPEESREPGSMAAPQTPVEEVLAAIWCRCLRVDRVGRDDDFFELGGHSLLVTQVVAHVRRTLGVEIPLATFFAAPTLAGLALAVEGARKLDLPPIGPVPRDRELPLSFAQERLWFLAQLDPQSLAYNVPRVVEISGRFDPWAMERAYEVLVARHEVLRTVFRGVEGRAVQRILPPRAFALPGVDLRQLDPPARRTELDRLIRAEVRRPFDLLRGPLLRALLVRLGEEEHTQIQTEHHLVHDGWTQGVLLDDMLALYAGFHAGRPVTLPELPIQYADYAFWQRQWMQGEVLAGELAHWRQRLAGIPPVLALPTDRPRPPVQSLRGSTQWFTLPADLLAALVRLSRRQEVTIFMTLLAAFEALLGRHAGVDDVVVGSPIANRTHVETEGLIGFFVNTLVLRADLAGNPPSTELLERVRTVALEAYAHQYLPFEKLVEELAPERSLAHTPLFQVMFVLQNARIPELRLPDVTLRHVEVHNDTAKFDLILSLQERAEGLAGWLEYSTDLFDPTTIHRLSGHLGRLLESIAAAPEQRFRDLPLLSAAEHQQLAAEWNDCARGLVSSFAAGRRSASEVSLQDLFTAQVERSPAAAAVVWKGQELSYLELDRRADQLARSLRELGVGVDSRVGIFARRSLAMVVAVLGTLKAGAACVPLDPTYPRDRLRLMVEDARPAALLSEESLLDQVPRCAAPILCLEADLWDDGGAHRGHLASGASADNLAYVIYSSGSTGRPKGVALPHRALVNLILWQQQSAGLGRPARTLQFTSLSFDVAFQEIFSTWCSGGTLVLIEDEVRRDSEALLDFLCGEGIERLFLPFVALEALAEAAQRTGRTPRHLREVITAGEQLKTGPALVRLFEQLAACALYNHYGPSESHVVTTFELAGPPRSWAALPPIGRPIANTAIWLLGGAGSPVPVGVPGELHIGGTPLARGYLERPDLTAERFVPDPLGGAPGGRLYRTGDLARFLRDGNVEFLGRSDHQVKVRGYRVELGEIEALLGAHPAVREAVVVVREPRPGAQRITAYLVSDRTRASVDELRQHLRQQLPEYMVPAAFVQLERMPLTPSGKVDRRALPVPEGVDRAAEQDFVAPRTPIETILAEMWSQVLGVERVGVEDNFFDLGGHSLLATQMLSRVRSAFQVEVPLRRLFERPVLAELARAVVEVEARPGQSAAIAALLTQVKSMSGEELQRELLSRKVAGGEL